MEQAGFPALAGRENLCENIEAALARAHEIHDHPPLERVG
jgi:hypothetical protein